MDDWRPPGEQPDQGAPECARCGEPVSEAFARVWAVDGEVDGCRQCLPRSVRFSRREQSPQPDDIAEFDVSTGAVRRPDDTTDP